MPINWNELAIPKGTTRYRTKAEQRAEAVAEPNSQVAPENVGETFSRQLEGGKEGRGVRGAARSQFWTG